MSKISKDKKDRKDISKDKNFENIEVSTKTIIAITNWNLNIDKIFDILPTTEYIVVPKKRGRKKKEDKEDPNGILQDGSIITIKYKDRLKGVDLKNKKTKTKCGSFRNSITVVMMINNKKINFKISKNGKFQLTGCKNDEYAEKCVKFIWNYIQERQDKNDIIDIKSIPEITFMTVMTNIDFNVGFTINRENLDKYINSNTEYNSLLETSFGYTGVNIKIPMKRPPEMVLKKLIWKNNNWENDNISYSNYLTTLEEKDRMKEVNKNRYNTFLVFHSGNVIMSSMHIDYMKDTYNKFINIIKECRPQIEEKIEA
jgi:TATA-box binding protein (TBP) (component of TFIID and TFIIIB)